MIAVTATFLITFAVASRVALTTVNAKKQLKLHLVFSQLFSLNAMFRCLFRLMISAYRQKNAVVKQKTLATFSEKSHSLSMNFSHQTKEITIPAMTRYHTAKALAVAVNKPIKYPRCFTKEALGIFML